LGSISLTISTLSHGIYFAESSFQQESRNLYSTSRQCGPIGMSESTPLNTCARGPLPSIRLCGKFRLLANGVGIS